MQEDGPRILPLESGVMRIQQMLGCEWIVGMIGVSYAAMLGIIALYGQWAALYGLPLWGIWHGIGVLMYRRDPQYWLILWRKEWGYPLPSYLAPAPGVCAPEMPVEPSVPVRGEAGAYVE